MPACERSETRRVDARLQAGLRAVAAGYAARLEAAHAAAGRTARDPVVQRALRTRDAGMLGRIAHGNVVLSAGGRVYGQRPRDAAARSVVVTSGGRTLGLVTVAVPVDAPLLERLGASLGRSDELDAARNGTMVAGPHRGATVGLADGNARRVRLGSDAYRALSTAPLKEPAGVSLVVLAPQHEIDRAARADARRLLLPLLGSLLVFALVTYVLGRSIVLTLRRLADAANALASGRLGERVEVRARRVRAARHLVQPHGDAARAAAGRARVRAAAAA